MSKSVTVPFSGATSFTLFPKLPPELRLKIWEIALPGSRIVKVEKVLTARGGQLLQRRNIRGIFGGPNLMRSANCIVKPFCSPITLLSVNQEARAFALGKYQLPFKAVKGLGHVRFDLHGDVLFVQDWDTFLKLASSLGWAVPGVGNGSGPSGIHHFMYGGPWSNIIHSLDLLRDPETLVAERVNLSSIYTSLLWTEDQLSGFLSKQLQTSKKIRVSLKTVEEMHKLAKLSSVCLVCQELNFLLIGYDLESSNQPR